MRNSLITAFAVGALVACSGGPSTPSSRSASSSSDNPRAADPDSLGAVAPELANEPANEIVQIGTQPVQDTPVATLPAHLDHLAVLQTPPKQKPVVPGPTTPLRHVYVSAQGNDAASGQEGQPFKTVMKAVSQAQAGDLIHVGPGTYAETVELAGAVASGTAVSKIVLQGEGAPTIVPAAGSGYAVVQVEKAHWVIDGFRVDVKAQPKYAVAFAVDAGGSSLTNSVLYNGTFGAGVTTYNNAHDVVIDNNHIYNFTRGNADSHGVVLQPTSKNITVRNNDIHNVSGDSVQCLGPEGYSTLPPADGVLIEANHFYANRENAVDIKTCSNVVIRANRMHGFTGATTVAGAVVVVHMSAKNVTIEDNNIYDGGKGIAIGGNHTGPVPTNIIVRRNKIHKMKAGGTLEGTAIRIENSSGAVVANNTMTELEGPALVIGHGTGGSTTNLRVLNNIIDAQSAVDLGPLAPGLTSKNNLFPATATFVKSLATLDFAAWKALGLDTTSQTAQDALVGADEKLAPAPIAVNAGAVDPAVEQCGSAPDIGAYESDC
jgi:hypothetical protein